MFSHHLNEELDDPGNGETGPADSGDNDDKRVEFHENIEAKSENKSKKSILSSRLSERKKADMVKALIKRSGSITSAAKDGKIKENNNKELIKKMEDRLYDEDQDLNEGKINQLANSNPLLKDSEVKNEYLSKSRSDKSLVSNSKLGTYVKTIKQELEKEKQAKDKAIDILKKIKKNFDINEL